MLLSPENVKWNVSCFICIEGKGGGGGEREGGVKRDRLRGRAPDNVGWVRCVCGTVGKDNAQHTHD